MKKLYNDAKTTCVHLMDEAEPKEDPWLAPVVISVEDCRMYKAIVSAHKDTNGSYLKISAIKACRDWSKFTHPEDYDGITAPLSLLAAKMIVEYYMEQRV